MPYHSVQSCCELLQCKWPRTLREGCPELISSVHIEGCAILRDLWLLGHIAEPSKPC